MRTLPPAGTARHGAVLAGVSVLALAFNLRPVVNAVGAVVPALRDDTGLSASLTGALLSLPVVAFALLGLAVPGLARRVGAHRAVVLALVALAAGQVLRAAVPGTWALFLGSAIALSGVAVANVVLPGLVRLHFPHRIATVTAAYSTTLTVGSAVSAGLSVPAGEVLGGSWRTGLAVWALPAALAVVPWLVLGRRSAATDHPPPGPRLPFAAVARTRVGRWLAVYFGIQAMLAYVVMGWLPEILVERGFSESAAGVQLAVVIAVGVPPALLVPTLMTRTRRPGALVAGLSGCYLAGFLGLVGARGVGVLVCSVLIGLGTAAFPLALSFIGLKSAAAEATTSLSAFAQSTGYVIAAAGPFAFGAVHELTGGWTVPLLGLAALAALQGIAGVRVVASPPLGQAAP